MMALSTFTRFYGSSNNPWKFPVKKYAYRLSVGASSAKMVSLCQDVNSFEGKSSSKRTFDQPKTDEKREQGYRNYNCAQFSECSRDEKEVAEVQERKRAAITVFNMPECLQDGIFYSEVKSSRKDYFQKFKLQNMGQAHLQNGAEGGHPKNHPGPVLAVTEQEVTGSEEKTEDFVNGHTPLANITNMECLRDEKEVAEDQESKGTTVLTVPNMSNFKSGLEIECLEDDSSYSPPLELVSSKRSYQWNPKNHTAKGTGHEKQALANENNEEEILRNKLASFYSNVMVVDNASVAKEVVWMLTNKYKHLVHACDTEVAKIDVKQETPVDHGEVICFSIYSGPEAGFGNGKSCIWVDLLDGGGRDLLNEFAPFFEDPSIKKYGELAWRKCP